jgi:invasion protein IalB
MTNARFFLAAALTLSAATGALAQGAAKPTLVGTFNDWQMWTYNGTWGTGEAKICFVYAEPDKMQPTRLDHGRVSFAVTVTPGQEATPEANFVVGYALKEQSSVTVDIGGESFTMFTQGDSAWLVDKADEPRLLAAMKKGRTMVIKATSRRGNNTTYNYSLSGITAATEKMQAECK